MRHQKKASKHFMEGPLSQWRRTIFCTRAAIISESSWHKVVAKHAGWYTQEARGCAWHKERFAYFLLLLLQSKSTPHKIYICTMYIQFKKITLEIAKTYYVLDQKSSCVKQWSDPVFLASACTAL